MEKASRPKERCNMKSIGGDPKDVRFPAPKGYVYTLEVLIAVAIILFSLIFILRTPPSKPDFETSLLKSQAFESLEFLDNFGRLKRQAFYDNETRIEQDLVDVMPKVVSYETEICRNSCATLNVPGNETVVSADYYIGSYRNAFIGKKVKLWAWKKF